MLAVIDYGAGNLRSVLHALKHLNAQNVKLIHHADELQGAEKIILPGVGAFGASMEQLHKQELVDPIKSAISSGVPFLGICIGMQILFQYSDEMGHHDGLGVLEGHVTRFAPSDNYKVPHMGWNQLNFTRSIPLFDNVDAESYAYFVHSYYCVPQNRNDIVVTTDYGKPFTAAVQRDNIFGVQFHPEKSQQVGLQILSNFLNLSA